MPRALRSYNDDAVLHVVNRGNDRRRLFANDRDYATFIGLLAWAQDRAALRVLAYALMPNHWHLVVWPRSPSELSQFMRDVTRACYVLSLVLAAEIWYLEGCPSVSPVRGRPAIRVM